MYTKHTFGQMYDFHIWMKDRKKVSLLNHCTMEVQYFFLFFLLNDILGVRRFPSKVRATY